MAGEDMSNYLVEKKVEILMAQGLKRIISDIDSLKSDVNMLKQEMAVLSKKINRMEMSPSPARESRDEPPDNTGEREIKNMPQKKLTVGAGPGAEKIDPSQFSVEKIFYSAGMAGKKK